jgi:hypothetical protein
MQRPAGPEKDTTKEAPTKHCQSCTNQQTQVLLRSGKTFDVIVERNAMAWSEATSIMTHDDVEACRGCGGCYLEWSALARNEAAVSVNRRHYSNIVERSETVVDIFVKIVDCRVIILKELLLIALSTVVSSKNRRVNFWPRRSLTHFLALQMVNFLSLHDDGGPVEVFYQLHSIELAIPLRMVVLSLIFYHNIGTF